MLRAIAALLLALAAVFVLTDSGEVDIVPIASSPIIEEGLAKYRALIGSDFDGYRNHIYRVLSYSLYILEKRHGGVKSRPEIEHALVHHDIGLWTDSVLNYLAPSVGVSMQNMKGRNLAPQSLSLIRDIIMNHHKLSPFVSGNVDYDAVVNAVRQADWVDASLGLVRFGISRKNQAIVRDRIPEAGFHWTLLDFGPRLHGWNVFKIVGELSKIFLW